MINRLIAADGSAVMVDPSVVYGWREGMSLDVRTYDEIGFFHPKDPSFYDSLDTVIPDDPAMWTIYNSILANGQIDNPVLLHIMRNKNVDPAIIVLDGATRLSCVSKARKKKPTEFAMVPAALFLGSDEDARGAMLRLNSEGRSRSLKAGEMVLVAKRMIDAGHGEHDIGTLTGVSRIPGCAANLACIASRGCHELIKAMDEGILDIAQAAMLARNPPDFQVAQVEVARRGGRILFTTSRKGGRKLPESAGKLRMLRAAERNLDVIADVLDMHGDRESRERIKTVFRQLAVIRAKILENERAVKNQHAS